MYYTPTIHYTICMQKVDTPVGVSAAVVPSTTFFDITLGMIFTQS